MRLLREQNRKIALYGILFLLFFQLLSDFVEAIYAFGLMGTSLPVEIVYVLLLFSPLVLLLFRRGLSGWPLVIVGELMLASRVVEVMLDTRGRMMVGGLGVACFLILLPSLLGNQSDEKSDSALGVGLTVGLSLSILFRVLGSGLDVSTYGRFQFIGWVLAIAAGVLLFDLLESKEPTADTDRNRPTLWRTAGISVGLISALVLAYFAFTSPNVIARWTGASYLLIISAIVLTLCLLAFLLMSKPHLIAALTPKIILVWNVLFVLSMALTILGHQVKFPSDAGGYPLPEPSVTLWHHVPLIFMLVLFPIILIDFMFFAQTLADERPSPRMLGGSFGLGSLFLLLMIFAQIFTTVYDYIPLVGPFFRDKFWFVFLLAGTGLTLPVLLVRGDALRSLSKPQTGSLFPGTIALVGLAAIVGVILTAPYPVASPDQKTTLRILTYNIQQGYSEHGLKNYDGQLDVIRGVDADIIGLQECDTNRIAGGNSDVVRYFADRLDLYSYYGPKTTPGTFGIALLSKYPIENPRTFYMYSEGEQTATLEAQITMGGKTFNLFVTHLGNGGPMVQQQAIVQELEGKENVVLMGDFNFRPDTEQYRLTVEALEDSWLLKWPQGADDQGIDPARRIDHVFVSPGTTVVDSRYLAGPQSDHPAMMTEIEW